MSYRVRAGPVECVGIRFLQAVLAHGWRAEARAMGRILWAAKHLGSFSPTPMTRLLFLTLGLAALFALAAVLAGEFLSRSANLALGPAPDDLPVEPLAVAVPSGGTVSAWLLQGPPGGGCVVLLHGVRSDRRQMLGRARFLWHAGYSVLLADLPAHGESPGAHITFGWREGQAVKAVLRAARHRLPGEKLAVIGVSLGAASFVLSGSTPEPDAVVLESMYSTIEQALSNRLALWLGPGGRWLAPALLWQMSWRWGFSSRDLEPVRAVASLTSPVLVVSGAEDRHTTRDEMQRIFDAARQPKDLWMVQGAAHVDLHAFDPASYEERILAFLARHLRGRAAVAAAPEAASKEKGLQAGP
jgi:uncharacterized protein